MYGVVLEGGGAKGSYHIGAYKAILELELEIGIIAGTSIGAVNGAVFAQGDYESAYEMWTTIKNSSIFDIEDSQIAKLKQFEISKNSIDYFTKKVKSVIVQGGLDTSVMRNLLESILDEEKLRKSKIDFALVTISLSDFKPLEIYKDDIPKGQLIDYIMASASFPGFKTGQIDGKFFIDGGLYNNLPINLVSNKGYTKIISIRTYGVGIEKAFTLPDYVEHIVIEPTEDLGKTLYFDEAIAKYNIELGYYDTMKVFKNLCGKKYYIKCEYSEDYFFDLLNKLTTEQIDKVRIYLGEKKDIPAKRYLFEILVPKIVSWIELSETSTYKEISIRIYEILADEFKLERFKIYDYNEFIKEIELKLNGYIYSKQSNLTNLMIQFDILKNSQKEELILNMAKLLIGK